MVKGNVFFLNKFRLYHPESRCLLDKKRVGKTGGKQGKERELVMEEEALHLNHFPLKKESPLRIISCENNLVRIRGGTGKISEKEKNARP